jgi:hypothetical protein
MRTLFITSQHTLLHSQIQQGITTTATATRHASHRPRLLQAAAAAHPPPHTPSFCSLACRQPRHAAQPGRQLSQQQRAAAMSGERIVFSLQVEEAPRSALDDERERHRTRCACGGEFGLRVRQQQGPGGSIAV